MGKWKARCINHHRPGGGGTYFQLASEAGKALSDLPHCIQFPELNQRAEVEVLRWEVEVEQIPKQSRQAEEIAALLQLRLPCIVGSIGRMLHSHHKLRTGLGLHSIERIEQHSRLQLLDCRRRVLMVLWDS
jgi:hypothetical protein